jgi:ClpP class serine protease
LAASAAYALACVADQIVLPASGEAGSVGVIAVPMSIARMLDEIGIDARIVKSGAKKADLHPAAPLSDAAIARLQADVDELASQFAGLVGERRGMSPDAVLALEAGVFRGQAAVAAGLADSVGNLADAKAAALAMAQISSGDSRRRMSAKAETKRAERPEGHRSMESIAKALGLKADATEGEIIVAITEQRALLTGFISLAGATSPSEATGVFRGWQEGTRRAEALAAQLAETTKAREAEEARTLLDAAISDGRLAPAAREEFAKLALPTLRGLLAALPRTGPVANGAVPPTRAGGAVLTDEDREICKQTGVSEEAFAKTKARRTGLGG